MKRCPKCFGSIRRMGRIEKPFYFPKCKEWFSNEEVTPKQTNADRVRSMSDEELEDFLDRWALGDIDYSKTFCSLCDGQFDCHECRLDWLREECE